jgi:hypothetical protein
MEESCYGLIWGTVPAFTWRGLRKTTKLSQDSWSLVWDLNPYPPEYETGVITNPPQRLVLIVDVSHSRHLLLIPKTLMSHFFYKLYYILQIINSIMKYEYIQIQLKQQHDLVYHSILSYLVCCHDKRLRSNGLRIKFKERKFHRKK